MSLNEKMTAAGFNEHDQALIREGLKMSKEDCDREDKIKIPCLFCGKKHFFASDSYEAKGVFNVFCSDKQCEDIYANTYKTSNSTE